MPDVESAKHLSSLVWMTRLASFHVKIKARSTAISQLQLESLNPIRGLQDTLTPMGECK